MTLAIMSVKQQPPRRPSVQVEVDVPVSGQSAVSKEITAYNEKLSGVEKDICDLLASEIDQDSMWSAKNSKMHRFSSTPKKRLRRPFFGDG